MHGQRERPSSLSNSRDGDIEINLAPSVSEDTASSENEDATPDGVRLGVLERKLALVISSLYSNSRVPRNVVQIFIDSYFKFVCEKESFELDILKKLRQSEIISSPIEKFANESIYLDRILFEKFKSDYIRMKYFSDRGTYVEPVEICIGERYDVGRKKCQSTNTNVPCTLQIIPISSVLTNFFSLEGILSDTLSHMENLKNLGNLGVYTNIMHGSTWQSMASKFEKDGVLHFPLVLYEDDFEISNPLGTKTGTYKLGGVYISIPCLSPKYVSSLNCIFALAFYHSSDRLAFGNHMIFEPVIKQLNLLSVVGITVDTDVYKGVIKFHVAAITGDNLGLHSILGFVENFRANYACRICLADKTALNSLLFEDTSLLRTSENYEQQLMQKDTSMTGIKDRCIWFRLDGFTLFEHTAVDVLHDFLEGTCRYTMHFLITELIFKRKIVGLQILQNKLRSFDYGPDSDSKPIDALVLCGSAISLKTTASEMITLVRYFALLIGHYVPEECELWQLFLSLRKLLEKLLNTRLTEGNIVQIQYLIAAHNELYKDLSKSTLKPKHHYMTHYGSMIKKFGPLTQTWTMRFEARHKIGKLAARCSANRRNVCKTIAIKNQLILNHIFLINEPFTDFSCGARRDLSLDDKQSILEKIDSLQDDILYSTVWVKKLGNIFRKNDIVTTSLYLDLPVFAKIELIVVTAKEDVYFKVSLFDTLCFDAHVHAFEVEPISEVKCWYPLNDLLSPAPNTLTLIYSNYFITQRVPID